MDAKPEGFYSTEWAGELITFVKQANQAGMFDKIKHVMFPVGAAMDVLEGLGSEMPDNVWISGRYFFLYPTMPATTAGSNASASAGTTTRPTFPKPAIPPCMPSKKRSKQPVPRRPHR